MATGSLPLTLGREDRIELFFEGRGHGQAFDDLMLCRVVPGIGFKVIRVFSASATNSGSFSVFRKAASTARTRSRGTPGGMAYGPCLAKACLRLLKCLDYA
jgi:hypothetical protein